MVKKGLQTQAVNSELIKQKTDFTQEIEKIKKQSDNSQIGNPAKNQEQLLKQVLRTLNSQYPYTVLTGDTGIGKSLTLEYVVDMLSNEAKFNSEIPNLSPQEKNLFKSLQKKVTEFKPQSYLFLPNFKDPKVVKPLAYSDPEVLSNDAEQFDELGNEILEFIDQFTLTNQEMINTEKTGAKIGKKFKTNRIFDQFYTGIQNIIEQSNIGQNNSELNNWGNDFLKHLKHEKKDIEHQISKIHQNITILTQHNQKHQDDQIDIQELIKKPISAIKSKEGQDIDIKEIRKQLGFELRYGGQDFEIGALLISNPIEIDSKNESLESKCVKFNSFNAKQFIAEFDENAPESRQYGIAPHMSIGELGPIFGGSLLYIKDDFKTFLETICYNEETKSKERFLEYLQTGKYTCETGGVSFEFDIPRIILGADNVDPFVRVEEGFRLIREEGLEARINQINVPSYIENTPQTREKTIQIILSQIEKLNQKNNSEKQIEFDNESINYLLNQMIIGDRILSLKYRDLNQKIDEIFTFAKSEDKTTIDIQTLKKLTKENQSAIQYYFADKASQDYEYLKVPTKSPGFVNGLSFMEGGLGSTIGIKSCPVFNRGKNNGTRFRITDIEADLADETTVKGFNLAQQYLVNFLSQIEDKQLLTENFNWQVLTQFHKIYGMGGPSASAAITASVISSLAQTDIYKTRHITGTIEPDGVIGQIGGIYAKASAPHRISQLTGEKQHVIFPASNITELQKDLILDHLEIQDSIDLIPVDNFNQAYALLTNPQIDSQVIKNSNEIGIQRLQKDIKNIEQRLKQEYKPKRKWFF